DCDEGGDDNDSSGNVDFGDSLEGGSHEGGEETFTSIQPPTLLSPKRQRPTWTWDWDLLKLATLSLNGEFAYRFQFRVLAGIPNLVYFSVDTNSWSGQHTRAVCLADLFFLTPKPGISWDDINGEGGGNEGEHGEVDPEELVPGKEAIIQEMNDLDQQEYIHLSHIKDFSLSGPWTFLGNGNGDGDSEEACQSPLRLLSTLFQKMIPNVVDLNMVGSQGSVSRAGQRRQGIYVDSSSEIDGTEIDGLIGEAGLEMVPESLEHSRLECLVAIIRILGQLHGLSSVATMLRVNKHVCSVTLPILYGGNVPVAVLSGCYPKDSPNFKRRQKLITTLLLGVPETHITDLLRVTFFQASVDGQEKYPVPYASYHSFATAISLHSCSDAYDGDFHQVDEFRQADDFNRLYLLRKYGPPPQRLVDFVKKHGLRDRYVTEAPLARLLREKPGETFVKALDRELRRDLTWALCSNLERLRFLTIPISDIDRFLPLVDRLKALSSVKFELDRRLFDPYVDLKELTPEQRTVLDHQRDERKQHLDKMVLFVQGLRQHHGNALQAALCYGEYPFHNEKCPEEYQVQLTRLLPPLPDPQNLGEENWGHFATKVKETNLSSVKYIMPPMSQPGALSLPRLLEQFPFLHRCRSFERIHLTSLSDDVFQWAVDERR
ncbi:hypothetical protein BG015_005452, partial [Linnemannia schmuckeri]